MADQTPTQKLLLARRNELLAKVKDLQAKAAPHRETVNKAYAEAEKIKAAAQPSIDAIQAIMPELMAAEDELSDVCRVTGGKFLSDGVAPDKAA